MVVNGFVEDIWRGHEFREVAPKTWPGVINYLSDCAAVTVNAVACSMPMPKPPQTLNFDFSSKDQFDDDAFVNYTSF